MSDFDDSGPSGSDPWAAVPGLPIGSTGQTPAAPPLGPRAEAAPAPPAAPSPLAPSTPDAPATGFGAFVQGVKDFFTGNTTVGDYKGGGTLTRSTDASRDLDQTAGQKQHSADEQAAKQSTDPAPTSWWTGMF